MFMLHTSLALYLLYIPFLVAQQFHARIQGPLPTAAPLFPRQFYYTTTCEADATSCYDNAPGCCRIGEACTTDTDGVPVCDGDCNGGPTCSGAFSGVCCEYGYTCDYQLTICVSESDSFSIGSMNGNPPAIPSAAAAAPSSVAPAPAPSSPAPARPTASQSVPSIAPATPASQAVQSSSTVTTSSLQVFASPPSTATDTDISPSSNQFSFSFPSASANSSFNPDNIETATPTQNSSDEIATPTSVQPTSVTTAVKFNAGLSNFEPGSGIAVEWMVLLSLGLAMMI